MRVGLREQKEDENRKQQLLKVIWKRLYLFELIYKIVKMKQKDGEWNSFRTRACSSFRITKEQGVGHTELVLMSFGVMVTGYNYLSFSIYLLVSKCSRHSVNTG